MCGFGYGFSGWMWVAMPLIMLLGIALVAVFIWGLVRWLNRRAALPQPRDARPIEYDRPPLEILQERYAHGEIDTATFENMRERLVASGARDDYR